MEKYYTSECNVQIVLALLKAYGIRKVIASPGTTNLTLVASMQQDPWFEMYSSADERSAAYMACGLAVESGEPVVLSCTGATASRNYMPGLTEAFYRKLPLIAITSTQNPAKIGHHIPQVIDRSAVPNDIVRLSVSVPVVYNEEDKWECEMKVNKALLELKHQGGGPVHINLVTTYSRDFSVRELPEVRVLRRICREDQFPDLPAGRIGVFVGAHAKWNREDTEALDCFCASHDAVVFCDHTSNYKGKYRVLYSLVAAQGGYTSESTELDLLIHIGEVSGEYSCLNGLKAKEVWRVSEDGEIRDTFRRLSCVFEMPEGIFFRNYKVNGENRADDFLQGCLAEYNKIYSSIPELPFSNIWIASKMAGRIPENSVIHFGILNSLRSWNFFELPDSVLSSSNVGGFGIDGDISSLVGASLAHQDKLYFGVLGDLAFFYDMNVLGNRHVGNNLRILLVNNGKGTEFRNYDHPGALFGENADNYIAAAGHYGNKSRALIRHYAEDLGFEYFSASGKEEFEQAYMRFLEPELTSKPILFEVFTDHVDENEALYIIKHISQSPKEKIKQFAKQMLGEKTTGILKKIIKP